MIETKQTHSANLKIKLRQQTLLAALLFLFLTIVASWPVLTNLETVIVGRDNDVYINPWADWWTLKALQDPELNLWQTDYLFYPQGVNLSFHSFSHLNTLVSLATRPLVGVLPAYNLAILFNYILAGLAMFQLARYTTGSAAAGVLAGIVFAFNSHNLYQSTHPVLVSVWCFPWITLFFLRAVRENRMKWAVATAVFVFLGAATSTILLILMGLWLAGLTIYLFLTTGWKQLPWRIVLATSALSLLFVLPLIFPLLQEAIANRNSSFLIDPGIAIVSDMASPIIPHWHNWLKRGLYLGIVPFCLLLLASIRHQKESRLWLWLLIGAYLSAIGPYPKLFDKPLAITLPWSLAITPLLRNPYRINILFSLGLAMLVAYGWMVLAPWFKNTNLRYAAFVIIAGLIYGEYTAVTFPHTPINVSPFYTEFLADVPDDEALAILPTGRQEDKRYLYYQTLHGHKITGGHVSRSTEETFAFIQNNDLLRVGTITTGFPPIALVNLDIMDVTNQLRPLSEAGIGYLVLHKPLILDGYIPPWQDWLTVSPVYEDDEVLVYRTAPQPGHEFEWAHRLTDEIGLIRASFAPQEAVQGGVIKEDLRWGGISSPNQAFDVCLELINDQGKIGQSHCEPVSQILPTSQWQPNEIVRGFYIMPVDETVLADNYILSLSLANQQTGALIGQKVVLGDVIVKSLQPTYPTQVNWSDLILLRGYDLQYKAETIELSFLWQSLQQTEDSYKLFVQLIDPASGTAVAQIDTVPRAWTYPTNIWEPDEVVNDTVILPLPQLSTGDYELWIGWYHKDTGERLPTVTIHGLLNQNNAIRLTVVQP